MDLEMVINLDMFKYYYVNHYDLQIKVHEEVL